MKRKSKLSALIITVITLISLITGSLSAYAGSSYTPSDPVLEFEASRSGNVITVDVKAASDFNYGSMQFYQTVIDDKTSYSGYSASIMQGQTQTNDQYLVGNQSYHTWNGTRSFDANAGDVLFSMQYNCNGSFEMDTDYVFSYMIEELYDADLISYETEGNTFTVKYREDTEFEVKFTSNGSQLDTQTIKKGNNPERIPEVPEVPGSEFVGWTTDSGTTVLDNSEVLGSTIENNTVFDAVWQRTGVTSSNTVNLGNIKVNKTLESNVTAPSDTYEFTFTAEDVNAGNVTKSEMPELDTITITTNQTLSAALGSYDFPAGGTYIYKVKETTGNRTGMYYDSSEYELTIVVEPDSDGNLQLTRYIVKKDGQKADGLNFVNTYVPVSDLKITKRVIDKVKENEEEVTKDTNKTFDFSITFTEPSITKDQKPKIDNNEIAYGSAYSFQLKNGETLEVKNIPEGTTYTITESGTEYYTGSVSITSGNVTSTPVKGEYAGNLTITGTVANGTNTAAFTNEYSLEVPDSGILHHNEMPVLFGLLAVAAAGSVVLNRKFQRKSR